MNREFAVKAFWEHRGEVAGFHPAYCWLLLYGLKRLQAEEKGLFMTGKSSAESRDPSRSELTDLAVKTIKKIQEQSGIKDPIGSGTHCAPSEIYKFITLIEEFLNFFEP